MKLKLQFPGYSYPKPKDYMELASGSHSQMRQRIVPSLQKIGSDKSSKGKYSCPKFDY